MPTIQELIQQKRKEIEDKKNSTLKTFKPVNGKHRYRILPSWKEGSPQFFHDFGMHWIKDYVGGDKKLQSVYVCADKTFGEPCPVCEAISQAFKYATDDNVVEILKEAYAGQRYLMNVLHRSGSEPETPQLMEIGIKIFAQICEIIEEFGDITDIEDGIDITISRSGSGFDTEYLVVPAAKSDPVNPSVLEKLYDIDAYVAQANPAKEALALKAVAGIIGVEEAPRPAIGSPTPSISHSEAEEGEYSDIDEDEALLSESDDLDDVIAGLDMDDVA